MLFFPLKLIILFALSASDPICKDKCGNGKSCKSSPRKGRQSRVSREGLLPYKDRRDIPRTLDTGNDRKGKLYREKIFVTTARQYKT